MRATNIKRISQMKGFIDWHLKSYGYLPDLYENDETYISEISNIWLNKGHIWIRGYSVTKGKNITECVENASLGYLYRALIKGQPQAWLDFTSPQN